MQRIFDFKTVVDLYCDLVTLQLNTLSRLDTNDPAFRGLLHSSRQMPLGLLKILESIENQWSVVVESKGTSELNYLINVCESILKSLKESYKNADIDKANFDRRCVEVEMHAEVYKQMLIGQEDLMRTLLNEEFNIMRNNILTVIDHLNTLRQPVTT